MRKILVTGANGFLGQHLCLHLCRAGFDVIATGRGPCRIPGVPAGNLVYVNADLTQKEAVDTMLRTHIVDVIVHAAALSKPDECEREREHCVQVNVEATRLLLQKRSSRFIYISTDFIFGEGGPHKEDTIPAPLNFYGETKLNAEKVVRENAKDWAIVRPVFIYGKVWQGLRPSFLQWVAANLQAGKPIKVVSDQLRTPTLVDDICKGIQAIIEREATGEYHLAGADIVSPYYMAMTAAEVLGLDGKLVESVTSETFIEPIARAKKSGLVIVKAIRELDYRPTAFYDGVRQSFHR